jgi:uncharacterized protein
MLAGTTDDGTLAAIIDTMNALRTRFGLTLMVNHACNLRCSYCYTGAKFSSPMSHEIGVAAINRAFHSLTQKGKLDLSFFGGEPLLEPHRILAWMTYARTRSKRSGQTVRFSLTTNGTVTNQGAMEVMLSEDLDLAVSFDGHAAIHNRYRVDQQGNGSASKVEATLRQLLENGKAVRVNVVVRPDTLENMASGLINLYEMGVRHVDLSLDLWTKWSVGDGVRLERFVEEAGGLWRQWMPEFNLNWFDAKVADLLRLPTSEETTLCGFGGGEIAVAPSGRLYPCERLIGEDQPNHPLCLPGSALEGTDFLNYGPASFQSCATCLDCALSSACDTTCRCSNFVRTGNVNHPDGLLCVLNKASARVTSRLLANAQNQRLYYAK